MVPCLRAWLVGGALLQAAADMGVAHAQYDIGRDYEPGAGGKAKDRATALAWLEKAEAQGDVLAVQRLARIKRLQ